jgi:hypothetical protein
MLRRVELRTVGRMAHRSAYLDRLAEVPAFRHCSRQDLLRVAQLVDEVELPAGARMAERGQELVITLEPTRVLVAGRRSIPALLELAPALEGGTPELWVRLTPACSLSSA